MPLSDLAALLSSELPELRAAPDHLAATESLALLHGLEIERGDLFTPIVCARGSAQPRSPAELPVGNTVYRNRAQPRGARRRKLSDGTREVPILWDDLPQ
jgi:hypothetical protein